MCFLPIQADVVESNSFFFFTSSSIFSRQFPSLFGAAVHFNVGKKKKNNSNKLRNKHFYLKKKKKIVKNQFA